MKNGTYLAVFGLVLAISGVGCGKKDSDPGPIDGTWNLSRTSCITASGGMGATAAFQGLKFIIGNTIGTMVTNTGSCEATLLMTLSYPGSNRLTVSGDNSSTIYRPSGCGSASAGRIDMDFGYSISGNTLTLTLQGDTSFCTGSDIGVQMTFTK